MCVKFNLGVPGDGNLVADDRAFGPVYLEKICQNILIAKWMRFAMNSLVNLALLNR